MTFVKSQIESKRFVSVGSFRKDMQELPDEVYENADYLIIDTETAKTEVGDEVNILEKGVMKSEQVITLGALFSGRKKIELGANLVFKSVGSACFDLAFCQSIYERINN